MTSVDQALDSILDAVQPLETEEVETLESIGRVAGQDLAATFNLPLFDNSAMDGYAVRTAEFERLRSLEVVGFIPAGAETWPELKAGSAIRIMTGAPVPQDADAIVPLEDTAEDGSGKISKLSAVQKGQHIRFAGEDIKQGDTFLSIGAPIGAPEVNLLAAMGITSLRAYRKPVVAILATGDELVQLGGALTRGKIFDSNSVALAAAVKSAGAVPKMLGIAGDNRDSLRQKITEGLKADALITAAGASVGDRDLVREILAELGASEIFWGVSMKPGKATAFSLLGGKPVFSLPGNPVSAMVVFEVLVRPALLKMGGQRSVRRPLAAAILQDSLRKKPGRVFFARVRLNLVDGKFLAWSSGPQDTGHQSPMLNADALAVLPADSSTFNAGDEIKVHILSSHFFGYEAFWCA